MKTISYDDINTLAPLYEALAYESLSENGKKHWDIMRYQAKLKEEQEQKLKERIVAEKNYLKDNRIDDSSSGFEPLSELNFEPQESKFEELEQETFIPASLKEQINEKDLMAEKHIQIGKIEILKEQLKEQRQDFLDKIEGKITVNTTIIDSTIHDPVATAETIDNSRHQSFDGTASNANINFGDNATLTNTVQPLDNQDEKHTSH